MDLECSIQKLHNEVELHCLNDTIYLNLTTIKTELYHTEITGLQIT